MNHFWLEGMSVSEIQRAMEDDGRITTRATVRKWIFRWSSGRGLPDKHHIQPFHKDQFFFLAISSQFLRTSATLEFLRTNAKCADQRCNNIHYSVNRTCTRGHARAPSFGQRLSGKVPLISTVHKLRLGVPDVKSVSSLLSCFSFTECEMILLKLSDSPPSPGVFLIWVLHLLLCLFVRNWGHE